MHISHPGPHGHPDEPDSNKQCYRCWNYSSYITREWYNLDILNSAPVLTIAEGLPVRSRLQRTRHILVVTIAILGP